MSPNHPFQGASASFASFTEPSLSRPLISLCLITGNCEEYIERCLTSFAPLADEIIVVRAIGNQEPDATLDIARDKFGAITAEYRNRGEIVHTVTAEDVERGMKIEGMSGWRTMTAADIGLEVCLGDTRDWPHVDDFAAARQMSFDLASGEYCFWCDTDDVLVEPEATAALVRELAQEGGYPVFIFPYEIFGRGVTVPRERMILKGSGKWKFPVHECFTFHVAEAGGQVQGVRDDRVVIRHLPHTTKTGSNPRNLRILEAIPTEELTPGLLFHLHGELLGAGRKKTAVDVARKAIESGGLGKAESYEIFLNLGRMAEKPDMRKQMLLQAYAADPTRREALGLLACWGMDYGEAPEALAFARQMLATLRPAEESWNDREAAYDWLGAEIYSQALRVNGLLVEAEKVRRKILAGAGGATIALVHATRGRAQQAAICRKMWLDLAENPAAIEHIFVMDADDELSRPLRRMHHAVIEPGGGCVAAWNAGANLTLAPVIVQLSDDWIPTPGWDRTILERLGGPDGKGLTEPRVLAISDGHRTDSLLCMAICTRAFVTQDFYLFHPDFTGVYSDNEFTDRAYERKQVIEARDIVFTHNHPFFTGKPMDRTHQEQNAPERYQEGLATYERISQGESWSSVPGFFNYWQFYREIAQMLQTGDEVAEIGVWLGRSVIFLAQECARLGKKVHIYAIDSFVGEKDQPAHVETVNAHGGSLKTAFEMNLIRTKAERVYVIEGDSAETAGRFQNEFLAFGFIDAAHDYESVKRDIAAWLPKIRPGGILAGHDADCPDVLRAVQELLPEATVIGPVWIYRIADCGSRIADSSNA